MPNILSFHLLIETGWNRAIAGSLPDKEDLKAMDRADAVILPQGCSEKFYMLAKEHCPIIFPNYEARFSYPGKTGQSRLFADLGVPCPRQLVLQKGSDLFFREPPFAYPFVVKGAWGGEGNNVVLINNRQEIEINREKVSGWLEAGGCLIQEYIPTGGRSLRVVVIGNKFYTYWRLSREGGFYSNLARGAVVSKDRKFENLEAKAIKELRPFCLSTGINLAGFDFLFSSKEIDPQPLFLEINYCFRTHGLGGPDWYLNLLEKGIREWIAEQFDGNG